MRVFFRAPITYNKINTLDLAYEYDSKGHQLCKFDQIQNLQIAKNLAKCNCKMQKLNA